MHIISFRIRWACINQGSFPVVGFFVLRSGWILDLMPSIQHLCAMIISIIPSDLTCASPRRGAARTPRVVLGVGHTCSSPCATIWFHFEILIFWCASSHVGTHVAHESGFDVPPAMSRHMVPSNSYSHPVWCVSSHVGSHGAVGKMLPTNLVFDVPPAMCGHMPNLPALPSPHCYIRNVWKQSEKERTETAFKKCFRPDNKNERKTLIRMNGQYLEIWV